jgi:hypothetical protein
MGAGGRHRGGAGAGMTTALRLVTGGALVIGGPLALAQGITPAALMLAGCALAVGIFTRDALEGT